MEFRVYTPGPQSRSVGTPFVPYVALGFRRTASLQDFSASTVEG